MKKFTIFLILIALLAACRPAWEVKPMAIDFDSAGQYITFPAAPLLGLSQVSILAWVDIDTLNDIGIPAYMNSASTSDEKWTFYWTADDKLRFLAAWTGGQAYWTTNDTISTGKQLIAVTYDWGSTGNDPVFYVNGVSMANTEGAAPSGARRSGTNSVFEIGDSDQPTVIDGRVYSLCIYSRILSADDIAEVYNSRLAVPANRRGLVFAPRLIGAAGGITDGGTLAAANTITDFVSGARGVPTGSPVFVADAYLRWR